MTREFVELELANAGATTRCVLDFRIADESHLVGVEAAFLRMARDRILNIDAVARFIQDCRPFASAMPYCDGICHYLYGVMAKERAPDSGLQQGQYAERYLRASDELSGFDRPLAHSVRALMAFHFNQFDEAELLAREGTLRHAAGAFAALLQGLPWHFDAAFSPAPGSAVEDLLTDQDTLQILADASHGLVELKSRADDLVAHLRRAPPGGYDRLKRMLLAGEALAAREDEPSHTAARRLARELADVYPTLGHSEPISCGRDICRAQFLLSASACTPQAKPEQSRAALLNASVSSCRRLRFRVLDRAPRSAVQPAYLLSPAVRDSCHHKAPCAKCFSTGSVTNPCWCPHQRLAPPYLLYASVV